MQIAGAGLASARLFTPLYRQLIPSATQAGQTQGLPLSFMKRMGIRIRCLWVQRGFRILSSFAGGFGDRSPSLQPSW